jgi:hypothetical protein
MKTVSTAFKEAQKARGGGVRAPGVVQAAVLGSID